MGEENRRLVERFWATMNTNDWGEVGALLHDDYTLEYPQSGERFRGRATAVAINAEYPVAGRWMFVVRAIVADAGGAASDVVFSDGAGEHRLQTFFQMRDGLIWRMVEYYPEPFDAPASRAHLVNGE
jgi:ketosteroid isomerase-like protein